jgi:hypothetical protein
MTTPEPQPQPWWGNDEPPTPDEWDRIRHAINDARGRHPQPDEDQP